MSMLAERKVKQKWSLNPRGKAWSEDSNKFGQKMLEKMGWSKGKGLGAKGNGIVEHVKIPYKNDSKGMGYKETDNQWTGHDSNFNALLESLSGDKIQEEIKISSLEQKSQSSRVRVHYKKFTRGKDLSRCSEKDLANIFGKKSLKETPQPDKIQADNEDEKKEEIKADGFTHNRGSMVDYFKKKIPNYGKNNGYMVGSNGVWKKDSDSEEESYVGFGFKMEKKRKLNGEAVNGTPKKRKKGSEEDDEDQKGLSNPAFDPLHNNVEVQKHVLNTIEEENEEGKDEEVSKQRKKKKRDASLEESFERSEIAVMECDTSDINMNSKKKAKEDSTASMANSQCDQKEDEVNISTNSQKMKKKKKKQDPLALVNPNFDDNDDGTENSLKNDTFEVKRKKKKDKSSAIDNPNFDIDAEENNHEVINDTFEIRRKKKRQNDCSGVENPNFDDVNEESVSSCTSNDFEVKRKKKKNGDKSLAIDNPNFDGIDEDNVSSCENNNFEVKRKKKKTEDDSFAIDNPNFDSSVECQNGYVDSNFEVKRKKKKKKKDLAIDNPNFEDSLDNSVSKNEEMYSNGANSSAKKMTNGTTEEVSSNYEEPSFDLMLNITSTPSIVKPEPKKQSSAKRRKSVRFSDVNQERIIPNREEIENRNELFDINSRIIANGLKDVGTDLNIEANIEEISKKIDGFQAEIENDINEAKVRKFIGEVGNPHGGNEKLPNGTKLKFKYAKFGRSPAYMNKASTTKAKTSYKHLIKGDIVVAFNNTNLHEIVGYGVKKGKK